MAQDTKKAEIESIRINVIKHQFMQFCKHNTQAIALLLKALMRGEQQNIMQNTTQESKLHLQTKEDLKTQSNSVKTPNNPLDLEG